MQLPDKVTIVEVGPRDGLQNEPTTVPTPIKLELIERLAQSGVSVIEATSFVSPKWVPQMADHAQLLSDIKRHPNVRYPVLVPNEQGYRAAVNAGATEVAVFTAASETFSQKNTNCSIAESLERITKITQLAKQDDIAVRGYISCVLGCPYEGDIANTAVTSVAAKLQELGCREISLGDTIGVGTANQVQDLIHHVSVEVAITKLAAHFHDTYGQALANIYAALQCGIATIDSSIAGLGGCPYARGASGNVATEDVVYLLHGMNIETGIDLGTLIAADNFIMQHLKRRTRSKVALALQKK